MIDEHSRDASHTGAARPLPDGYPEQVPAHYGYGYGRVQDTESDGGTITEHIGIIYRRRWIALTAFLLVVSVAVVRNYTAVPVFHASARVLMDPERLNLLKIEDIVTQRRSLDAELAVLRSRWLARETLYSLGVLKHASPAAPPATKGAPQAAVEPVAQGDGTELDFWERSAEMVSKVIQPAAAPSAAVSMEDGAIIGEDPQETRQINAFLGGLSISGSNGVFDIGYTSLDATQAARYANAHAQSYIDQTLASRASAVQEATGWLRERLNEQRQRLEASDKAVIAFQEQHGLVADSDGSSIVGARLNELSASMTRAQAERLEKEALYNRALGLRGNSDELDRIPAMQASATLQQFRTQLDQLQRERDRLSQSLREAHPEMVKMQEAIQAAQARLDGERARVLEALRLDFAAARDTENGLRQEFERLRRDAASQNRHSVELSILKREAESNREIYEMLTQRARETGVTSTVLPSRTRILDPAVVPGGPTNPNSMSKVVQAAAMGLVLAVALAIGVERLDNRIKVPRDITQALRIPFIGLIPELQLKERQSPLLTTPGLLPHFAEELRRIRTNILFSFAGDSLRSLAVTSTGPSEGKTVVACNLAITLAEAGQRVLLIDCDLRRPAVHTRFDMTREPGLTNVLVGSAKAGDALRRTNVTGLWVLPAGHRPPNPSELLGSQPFGKLLAGLGEHFDWVVLDTPPVTPVTDACVLAHTVSGILFVAGAERVNRPAARRAVEQLLMADAKVVGGVLNRVEMARHRQYYGAYYEAYKSKYDTYADNASKTASSART